MEEANPTDSWRDGTVDPETCVLIEKLGVALVGTHGRRLVRGKIPREHPLWADLPQEPSRQLDRKLPGHQETWFLGSGRKGPETSDMRQPLRSSRCQGGSRPCGILCNVTRFLWVRMDLTADTIGLRLFVSTNTEVSPSPFTPQFPPPRSLVQAPHTDFHFRHLAPPCRDLRSPTQKTGKVSLTNTSPGVLGLASKSNRSEMGCRLPGDRRFPRVRKPGGKAP